MVRNVGVDPRYGLEDVQKFINVVMWQGKKNTARNLVYGAFDIIARKMGNSHERALEVFQKAVINATPTVEVRARRVGGSVYQIPREVATLRGRALAFRSLIGGSEARKGATFAFKLAEELLEAAEGRGGAVKAKLDKHKMADSNRAFTHFAW